MKSYFEDLSALWSWKMYCEVVACRTYRQFGVLMPASMPACWYREYVIDRILEQLEAM